LSIKEFWQSLEGVIARLADLAHHFTWSTVNTAIRETVVVIEEEKPVEERGTVSWVTMGDDRVCGLCEENEGEYELDETLPEMPGHLMCRCHWELTVKI